MAVPHAEPGQIIDLIPQMPADSLTKTLIKSDNIEVIRLMLPAGKAIAEHKVDGEITVQCLSGQVQFTARGKVQALEAGQLLYLSGGDPHALQAVEDSAVLITIQL